ncbi:hypothetical protein LMG27174_04725 [Paraburkholderia rhynchosiae]|uniref:Uncharacterized protein n=1 Tax=Paraburkholderia rhynchosiae TaxID=487049 RepID=A0A6J5BWN5_9BURK|nr:hypothetical protein LMG27174_04725 [Paraburkholderia rhynchosiae]
MSDLAGLLLILLKPATRRIASRRGGSRPIRLRCRNGTSWRVLTQGPRQGAAEIARGVGLARGSRATRHASMRVRGPLRRAIADRKKHSKAARTACPRTDNAPAFGTRNCCVAPSLCWPASKCVVRQIGRLSVRLPAKPRCARLTRAFHAIGTAFAFNAAIGSTWIRREPDTKCSPQYKVRTTASPGFSHRLDSRDAVFISGAARPMTARRRPTTPAH